MSRSENKVIATKPCKCGCGMDVQIRNRHLSPSHSIPDFIRGHQQFGNKRGWKTGTIKDVHGYVWVCSPNHPNKNVQGKGYVKRSRLVVEQRICRFLTEEEIIHHVNGIRDDDRSENLLITTKSEHQPVYHKRVANRNPLNGRFAEKGGDAICQTAQ